MSQPQPPPSSPPSSPPSLPPPAPRPWEGERSRWLLRHLEGPVRWQAWHPDRLPEAAARNQPLLLVLASENCLPFEQMARESFADEDTARVMNEGHLCVLADARWHPELDRQLQLAHQLLTGRAGGWPLLALIDPLDARPYFVGSYLPAAGTAVLPGFRQFLTQALLHHQRHRTALLAQSERLAEAFARMAPAALSPPGSAPDCAHGWMPEPAPLAQARAALAAGFQSASGKFIVGGVEVATPLAARWLMRCWRNTAESAEPDLHALYLATRALTIAEPAHDPPECGPAWLQVLAAAAVLTGDADFRVKATVAAETLLADVADVADVPSGASEAGPGQRHPAATQLLAWQALALAGQWLDRADWLGLAGRRFGDWRRENLPAALSLEVGAAALSTALALLPVRWHEGESRWAVELASALASRLAEPAAEALPGLPWVPQAADGQQASPLGMAIGALSRFARLAESPFLQQAATTALARHWTALCAAPASHCSLLEALSDQLGQAELVPTPTGLSSTSRAAVGSTT